MKMRLVPILVFGTFGIGDLVSAQSTAAGINGIFSPINILSSGQPGLDGPSTGDPPELQQHFGLGVLPEDIVLIGPVIPPNPLTDWATSQHLRLFGWIDGGYTWSSTGSGLLAVEPRPNRFGNSWILDQAALVLERTLTPDWSWGFRGEFYMGADTALLRPVNGFGPTGDQFGTDFRQAYLSIHLPLLTEGGIDLKLGRQYVPIGYQTTMAPYRSIYSLSYEWIYATNGASTGAIATVHVDPTLDVIAGVTLGVNSLFNLRGRAPCYILRGLYSLDPDNRIKLVGTVYTGPMPIASAPGNIGKWDTLVELQARYQVNARLALVSETNIGWCIQDPAIHDHTSQWYATYGLATFQVNQKLDLHFRAEWFYDVNGARIGTAGHYFEITSGLGIRPEAWLNFRPEIRWDGATSSVFGPETNPNRKSSQWTLAFDTLFKF